MKFDDIKVGDHLLYNSRQPSHRNYDVADCSLVEVLRVGVEHRYSVTTGGWAASTEYRTDKRGIEVRRLHPEGFHVTSWQGDTRSDAEKTVQAAAPWVTRCRNLQPVTDDAQAAMESKKQQKERARARQDLDAFTLEQINRRLPEDCHLTTGQLRSAQLSAILTALGGVTNLEETG